jgi:hypothetical protein
MPIVVVFRIGAVIVAPWLEMVPVSMRRPRESITVTAVYPGTGGSSKYNVTAVGTADTVACSAGLEPTSLSCAFAGSAHHTRHPAVSSVLVSSVPRRRGGVGTAGAPHLDSGVGESLVVADHATVAVLAHRRCDRRARRSTLR